MGLGAQLAKPSPKAKTASKPSSGGYDAVNGDRVDDADGMPDDDGVDYESVGQDILAAVAEDDPKAVGQAIRAAVVKCMAAMQD